MKTTFLSLATCSALICAAHAQSADTLYVGGAILTLNDHQPRAEAVAVKDGKILAVGSQADTSKFKGQNTKVINLSGRTLIPGFVDAHGHVMGGGIQAISANLLPPPDGGVKDIAELQKTLKDWVNANEATVKKVGLIVGFGYDNAQLKERRHPLREELDEVSKELPVLTVHQSGHIAAVNSKALELGGVTADSPEPVGGVIRRRAGSKEPDGVLEETAAFPVIMKLISRVGPKGAMEFLRAGTEMWARFGYTTAQDGRTTPGALKFLKEYAESGALKIDVVSYPDVLLDRDLIKRETSRAYKNRFRVAGAKLTIDGSAQGFTAWRDRPYYKPVGAYPPAYAGYPSLKPSQATEAIDWAFANNIQILTHANGEAASDLLIASIDAAIQKHGGGDRRPVLIHGQLLREDQVDSYKRLNVIPSLFPMHTFYWGDWHRDNVVGPARVDNISPTGWCVQRGMRFTSHHDAPVAFPDSMRVLDATVTRRSRSGDIIGPAQRVDVITALKAMTLWSAWQHFEEQSKGSIEVGKLADLLILDSDPTAVDPESLDQIKIHETIKEGVTIYSMPAAERGKKEARNGSKNQGEQTFARLIQAAAQSQQLAKLGVPGATPFHNPGCQNCMCVFLSDLVGAMAAQTP